MSNDNASIREQVAELQDFIVNFYNIEPRILSIKIVPGLNFSYTKLSESHVGEIFISNENLKVKHIVAHEIAHTQIPVRNKFFAEGFASLISCKIAGNCSPFWFSEKNVIEVMQNNYFKYICLQEAVNNEDVFNDFAKFSTRFAHVIAASFTEWVMKIYPDFANNIINNLNIEPEVMLFEKYKLTLPCLEQKWLKSIGVALLC